MTLVEVQEKIARVVPVLREKGVVELSVIGSVARQENSPSSDVDFLVVLSEEEGIDTYFTILFLLEEILGGRVDLIEKGTLKQRFAEKVIAEAVRVA